MTSIYKLEGNEYVLGVAVERARRGLGITGIQTPR